MNLVIATASPVADVCDDLSGLARSPGLGAVVAAASMLRGVVVRGGRHDEALQEWRSGSALAFDGQRLGVSWHRQGRRVPCLFIPARAGHRGHRLHAFLLNVWSGPSLAYPLAGRSCRGGGGAAPPGHARWSFGGGAESLRGVKRMPPVAVDPVSRSQSERRRHRPRVPLAAAPAMTHDGTLPKPTGGERTHPGTRAS